MTMIISLGERERERERDAEGLEEARGRERERSLEQSFSLRDTVMRERERREKTIMQSPGFTLESKKERTKALGRQLAKAVIAQASKE